MSSDPLLSASLRGRLYGFLSGVSDEERKTYKNEHGETYLHYACLGNNPDIAQELIELGVDINASTHRGRHPIHYAAANAQPEVIRVLCEAGVDLTTKDPNCNLTPLQIVIRWSEELSSYTEKLRAPMCIEILSKFTNH